MSIITGFLKKCVIIGALALVLTALFVPTHHFFDSPNAGLERGCSHPITIMSSPLAAFCDVDASVVSLNADVFTTETLENHEQILQTRFEQVLARFKRTKDYGETALQNVIDLLGYELKLVRLLFYGNTGAVIDYALEARNTRLEYSIPSVVLVYRTILDLVTYDPYFNPMLSAHCEANKQLSHALNHDKRRAFLFNLETKLMQYQNSMRKLQYEVVLSSSVDADNAQVDSSIPDVQ